MKISFSVVGTEVAVDAVVVDMVAVVGSIAVVAASVVEDRRIEVAHNLFVVAIAVAVVAVAMVVAVDIADMGLVVVALFILPVNVTPYTHLSVSMY